MIEKILIVGPAWVGDMVMAQTLFKLIKQRKPAAIIDVLAPAWSLPLLERMPEVNLGIAMPIGHGQLNLKQRYQLAQEIKKNNYSQAILLPNSFKSALIPFLAGIPLRTGWRGEMRYIVLNDVRILDKKKYPLMIERFMALGLSPKEDLPADYPLPALTSSPQTQSDTLQRHQLSRNNQPILAICPGAEFGPAKRWPEKYYAQVANAKIAEGWQVWILGSPKDNDVAEVIQSLTNNQCVNLTGKTALVEAVDLLAAASAVLSNDSGLMHIAAALHKPLVVVYGPTSAGFTPPLNQNAKTLTLKLPCQPCFQRECPLIHHRCMLDLTPETVLQTLHELMRQ